MPATAVPLQELRPSMFAIHAFNVETALIPDQVSQAALAEMRFQWWREAINSMATKTPLKHPLIQSLSQVLAQDSGVLPGI